jgi:transposase
LWNIIIIRKSPLSIAVYTFAKNQREAMQIKNKVRPPQLDGAQHAEILAARSKGTSMKDIAIMMNRGRHQICRICKNHDKNGLLGRQPGSGRKRKTSQAEDAMIIQESNKHEKISGFLIRQMVGVMNVSERTVRRRIKESAKSLKLRAIKG